MVGNFYYFFINSAGAMGGCIGSEARIAKTDIIKQERRPIQQEIIDSHQVFKAVPIQHKAINLSEVGGSQIEEKTSQKPQWQAPPPVVAQPEIKPRDKFTDQSAINILYSSDANDLRHLQKSAAPKANDPKAIIYEEPPFKIQKNPIPSHYRIKTSAIPDLGLEKTSSVPLNDPEGQAKERIIIRRITSNISQKFVTFPQEQFINLCFDFKIIRAGIDPFFGSQ